MKIKYIKYLDFDADGIRRVGCMRCNNTVASRQEVYGPNGGLIGIKLVHMSHSRRLPVKLSDRSEAAVILCIDCVNGVTEADMALLEKTMKWGWRAEKEWEMNAEINPSRSAKLNEFKKALKIKENEAIPESVWDDLYANKGILRRA